MSGDPNAGTPGSGGYGGAGLVMEGAQLFGMLYDSYQNRKTSRENTDKTIAANKAEAELAYQRSIAEWNRQNLYNDPQSQMARFEAAGLNPHLIYGQGNAGNASSPPSYSPPNLQYRYEAPTYGAAFASVLPTLMSVGTWLQNMRVSEAGLIKTQTETERARQMIDFLEQKNPKEISRLENALSLFPYQHEMQRFGAAKSELTLADMESEYRYKYGDELFRELRHASGMPSQSQIGGVKKLQFLQEAAKTKLLDAKSSWSEFDVTDPQQIMMLVLNGVMGLAGQSLRLSTHKRPKTTNEVQETLRNGRTKIRRTIRE